MRVSALSILIHRRLWMPFGGQKVKEKVKVRANPKAKERAKEKESSDADSEKGKEKARGEASFEDTMRNLRTNGKVPTSLVPRQGVHPAGQLVREQSRQWQTPLFPFL